MRLLYVGDLDEYGTCRHRMLALERLGFELRGINVAPYLFAGSRPSLWLRLRTGLGRQIIRLNRAVLDACRDFRPDFVWFDKPIAIWPETVESLRRAGAVSINYTCDNPFSPMGPDIWRHARRNLATFDLNLVPRPSSVEEYRQAGARQVAMLPFAFDPFHNYPARPAETGKTLPVAFIGTPHGDRPRFLRQLAQSGLPVVVMSAYWPRFCRQGENLTVTGQGAWGEAYRRAILGTRQCLAFITHAHGDLCAHKSFEIAACGSFLLAERSDEHLARFEEGIEAEFFSSPQEAADKARHYLTAESAREGLARAGCRRAWSSGYSNDERLAAAFSVLDPALAARLTAAARGVMARRRAEIGL